MSTLSQRELTSGLGEILRLARPALEYAVAALLEPGAALEEILGRCGRTLREFDRTVEESRSRPDHCG